MADDEPLTVDYWELAYALGRALHDDEACFWAVVAELDKTFPGLGWHNTMTDSPATPVMHDVFIDGLRFRCSAGEHTGHALRLLAHPPISDDYDIFFVVDDDGQEILVKDLQTVYIDRPTYFVTKDRQRP